MTGCRRRPCGAGDPGLNHWRHRRGNALVLHALVLPPGPSLRLSLGKLGGERLHAVHTMTMNPLSQQPLHTAWITGSESSLESQQLRLAASLR